MAPLCAAKGLSMSDDFNSLGLAPRLIEKLSEQGITKPTPIQLQAIPEAMKGRDVMGLAQTGTGKTAAFGLPLLHKLLSEGGKPSPKTVRALILAPTRELAKQIQDNLKNYSDGGHIKVGMVVGGVSINPQIKRLERGLDLLVATPGRLIDLLDRKAVRLDETKFLVLDEADQMLDMGFIHALRQIAPLLPRSRQTMLFSATMPKQMAELAKSYLNDPVRIQVAPPGKPADKVTQEVHFIATNSKTDLLIELLEKHRDERALVFGRTKHGSERLKKHLEAKGFAAASIHGNKSQGQRDRAIQAFRDGEVKILVATDVAARGIDIPGVKHVYNFDLPNVAENYIHRIGRTARADADGAAIAFCSPQEMDEFRAIEKMLKIAIPTASGSPWQKHEEEAKPKQGGRRGGGGGGGQRRSQGGGGRPGGGGGGARGGKPANSAGKPGGQRRRKPARG
jgi:ATP-dependent RNA helicase RhlE